MEKVMVTNRIEDKAICLKEGEKLTYVVLADRGFERRHHLKFELKGKNAELIFFGFIIGIKSENFNFDTTVTHTAPEGKSKMIVKSALFGRSMVDYKGNIIIEKKAQLSDAYLAHKTLLLSDQAKAHTVPALEIKADDVKVSHAAAVSSPDSSSLFYLMSRGIPREQAKKILIKAFFDDLASQITDKNSRTRAQDFISRLLMHGEDL